MKRDQWANGMSVVALDPEVYWRELERREIDARRDYDYTLYDAQRTLTRTINDINQSRREFLAGWERVEIVKSEGVVGVKWVKREHGKARS